LTSTFIQAGGGFLFGLAIAVNASWRLTGTTLLIIPIVGAI